MKVTVKKLKMSKLIFGTFFEGGNYKNKYVHGALITKSNIYK